MERTTRRILLADDEPHIRKIVGKRLELAGFEVVTAEDGEEAIAKARVGRPDILLLDLMLPKKNGLEVCAELRREEHGRRLPIIIFSARSGEMDERLCRDAGADAFITKPHGSAALLEQVEALLGKLEAQGDAG